MSINSPVSFLQDTNISDLSNILLDANGRLRLFPASTYHGLDQNAFRLFCHQKARYGIPTIEQVEYIKQCIAGRSAIEIGAGCGDLGFHIGIPRTDSKSQANPIIAKRFELMGQPSIQYPDDVIELDALQAVYKYKPEVVVASWITTYAPRQQKYGSCPHGVKESKILNLCETLIIVGNMVLHGDKPIRALDHKTIMTPWIVSRAKFPEQNCIFIWDKRNGKI